ncbi:SRPBCC family protein [Myxococcota bacterium]|nr:SRPBCC family protein [Myxococcota bacterium]
MPTVTRSMEIQAPARDLWATIADFASVERYSPIVEHCRLEGEDGVGQIRRLTLTDGSETVSRMTALDEATSSMSYQILETALPLTNYSSTMRVEALGNERSRITWSSQFEPQGATEDEARGFLETQLDDGLEQLRALHEPPRSGESG